MKQTFIVGVETDKKDFNKWIADHDKQIRNEVIVDIISKIDDEYYDGGYGDYHEVAMIVRMLEQLKGEQNGN